MRRRAVLAGGLALGGCGFRPLYMPESSQGSVAATELAAVYVPVIPERSGQLLRQALQTRIEGSGLGVAKKFELVATFIVNFEAIAIQRDSSATRYRLDGRGNWTLRKLDLAHTVITAGSSRALGGTNINNQQYFAADNENETAIRRVADTLADQIISQVASFLRRQALEKPQDAKPT